jgi:hypothetical protein
MELQEYKNREMLRKEIERIKATRESLSAEDRDIIPIPSEVRLSVLREFGAHFLMVVSEGG